MNCLDCALDDRGAVAIAVCHACGAGVCVEHAVVRAHHLVRIVTINRPVPVEPPARLVWCPTCACAHDAVDHHDRAHHPHLHHEHGATS